MKKFITNQNGISLTEIVVYVGVFSMLVVGLVAFIVQFINVRSDSSNYSTISNEASNILEQIIYDVRHSDGFNVLDEQTLEVQKEGNTVNYYLEDSIIKINDGDEVNNLSSTKVKIKELLFQNLTSVNSRDLLKINFTIEKGDISEEYQTATHKR